MSVANADVDCAFADTHFVPPVRGQRSAEPVVRLVVSASRFQC